jgi:aminoglycoside phosphotransferase family enzyme/predicted kinase
MNSAKHADAEPAQARVVAFLEQWARQRGGAHFRTHGAHVFVAGAEALKIKRAVRYPYLDFSTLELRRQACERELEVNRANAPEIYLGVEPITRGQDGRLTVGGNGPPVDWAVRMRAFDQADLLSARAASGALGRDLANALADAVLASHVRAPAALQPRSADNLAAVVQQVGAGLARHSHILATQDVERCRHRLQAQLERGGPCLERRAAAGCVRRVHGDLHLDNVVVWRGAPVLFDAIEFDEDLATIDVLYDIAFLLMDLVHRGRRDCANAVLNRYLWRSGRDIDLAGLVALPLFLGLRASVRALVTADRLRQAGADADRDQGEAAARAYLSTALAFLEPQPARIVAVGGLSGTGKSTLAASLASDLGPAPGAVHLRSDLERKTMFHVDETVRLGPDAYTTAASSRVYGALLHKAGLVASAGHAVIVDAVFARPDERDAIEAAARTAGVPFQGLWLTAPRETLLARVAARTNDASDATPEVVEQQLAWDADGNSWPKVEAGGSAPETQSAARRALGLS